MAAVAAKTVQKRARLLRRVYGRTDAHAAVRGFARRIGRLREPCKRARVGHLGDRALHTRTHALTVWPEAFKAVALASIRLAG